MTTTLIVRDATLAINGAPEKRAEHREHLRSRIAEVARMDPRTAEDCVEALSGVSEGEGADPDVLEALIIVGIAQPDLAERLGVATLSIGRRLASRLEKLSEIERTMAVLELLQQHFPGNDALEHDLAQLMRRQGMIKDLVERYFGRARSLMREGRNGEAAGWLREVLQLDPSRKEAARMIRNLRFKGRGTGSSQFAGFLRFLLLTVAISVGGAYAVLRELRLRDEFRDLPRAVEGRPETVERRLASLERFVQEHPIWHGALGVLAERSELRVQVEVLRDGRRLAEEAEQRARVESLEAADLCRARGMNLFEEGDLTGALEAFREALGHGGESWPERQRVQRDVADLEAHLLSKPR
jgi:tetratricopeptide (TPR) repeat protein